MKIILIVLFFAAVIAEYREVCRRNEEWTDCDKQCSDFINRCEHLKKGLVCRPRGCTSGCICKEGYYRDDDDRCVRARDCPQLFTCGRNEEYEPCSTRCGEATCDNRRDFYCGGGDCTPKCHCKEGYVRNYENKCIRVEKCKLKECGRNEEYTECNRSCDRTYRCENLFNLEPCEPSYCASGCICKKGYFRNEDNKCVKREDCPPLLDCDRNEEYVACSTRCVEASCDNKVDRYCGAGECKPKCHCKKGYVRNYDQTCVRADKCPARDPCKQPIIIGHQDGGSFTRYGYDSETKKCIKFSYDGFDGNENRFRSLEQCQITCEKKPICRKSKHEVYSECGAHFCQASCVYPNGSPTCKPACTPGCVCEEGYIRDSTHMCIRPKYCPDNDF